MNIVVTLALILLAALPASAQGKDSCRVFFKVEFDDARIAGGFVPEMDAAQQKWWETKGHKKYPGVCYDPTRAQYVLRWQSEEHSKVVDVPETHSETHTVPVDGTVTDSETGDTAQVDGTAEVTTTNTSHHLEQVDWTTATMNVLRLDSNGKPQLPPVYVVLGQRGGSAIGRTIGADDGAPLFGIIKQASPQQNALEAGVKFLFGQSGPSVQ